MMLMDWLEILVVVLGIFSYIGQGLIVLFIITWILDNRLKILERFKLTWEFIIKLVSGFLIAAFLLAWLFGIFWATITPIRERFF